MRGIPAFGQLAVFSLLLACTAPVAERGFRDPSAPFASISRFETPRFLGEWVRVAEFTQSRQGIAPQTHLYRLATTGQLVVDITGADGATERQVYDLPAAGRLRASGSEAQAEELWVLWVDEGFRTAVLGTPSGSRAFILDRSTTPAPDRLRAAREILNWYGYDMAQLEGAM
jgi:apolipoprotein D and lipocalin family protein